MLHILLKHANKITWKLQQYENCTSVTILSQRWSLILVNIVIIWWEESSLSPNISIIFYSDIALVLKTQKSARFGKVAPIPL